ncbi:MAG: nickel-binding protein [Nitrososphaera sp.]
MPVFLDVHKVPFGEAQLRELCQSPVDEFGVTHVNLFYNKESGVCFCLLEGPDMTAIEKHHSKVNIKCEWITEVSLARPFVPPAA